MTPLMPWCSNRAKPEKTSTKGGVRARRHGMRIGWRSTAQQNLRALGRQANSRKV